MARPLKVQRISQVTGSQFSHDKETVEIVTQLSIDRIPRLEIICNVWNGPIVAAILVEDRTDQNPRQTAQQIVQILESVITTRVGFHSLTTILVSRENSSDPYPINGLRNIALQHATSEFVFLLDVDCIPSRDLFDSFVGTSEMKNSLRNICVQNVGGIVVPCFEPSEDACFNTQNLFTSDEVRTLANLPSPQLRQFAITEFDRGHGATNFSKWLSSGSDQSNRFQQYYQVDYQEGFEPFIIIARILTPLYCEELVGYGRNKILHLYHLHRLGISFWVTTAGCIVHTPHSLSTDRIKLLGSHESSEEMEHWRLEEVKSIYQKFRERATVYCASWSMEGKSSNTSFSNFSNLSSPLDESLNQVCGSSIASWPTDKYLNDLVRSVFPSPVASDSCFRCIDHHIEPQTHCYSEQFLADLCSIHMVYKHPSLCRLRSYGFDNLKWNTFKVNEIESSIWLVTHLSFDRLNRLISLCSGWEGPVAAVIWIPPNLSSRDKRNILRELDHTINSTFLNSQCSCQIKFIILENSVSLSSRFRDHRPRHGTRPRPLLSPSLYPFNALRGAALDIVEECEKSICLDSNTFNPMNCFVLIVDVDMRPPRLLYKHFSESSLSLSHSLSHSQEDSSLTHALQCCVQGDFLILPALELRHLENHEMAKQSLLPNPLTIEDLLSTSDLKELKFHLKSISQLIQPFHIQQYPEGHNASQTSLWLKYVLSEQAHESVSPLSYQEGYEPYGILSLKTVLDCGGFHRSFVGRHRDKIEFVMRLHMLGIDFKLWLHPTAFVFDWLPHPPLTLTHSIEENQIHRIVMEGLYRRSKRQTYRSKEIPWTSSSTSSTLTASDSMNLNLIHPSLPFDNLPDLFRSSIDLGEDFWRSDKIVKVHSSQPIPSSILTERDTHLLKGMFHILQDDTAKTLNGIGISIPFSVTIPMRTITSIGISSLVQFPSNMTWHGGSLFGVRATNREMKTVSDLPFARRGEIDGRIKWNEKGNAHFQLTGIPVKTPGFHIVMNRETQFHKGVWHRIEIVFSLEGQVEATVDGSLIFSAKYIPKFLSLDGIRMSVLTQISHLDNEMNQLGRTDISSSSSFPSPSSSSYSDPILLRDINIRGSSEAIGQCVSETSLDKIRHLISNEVTVIFAPKEWHSLSSHSLADFLSSYSSVFHLIIVIAPPIPQTTLNEMRSTVSLFPESHVTFHKAQSFQNPYEIRNILSQSIQSKYTLHLNNDIFSVTAHPHWLEELLKSAEENPQYCAMMPFLLENNSKDTNRLHVWWKECQLSLNKETNIPDLHAIFDNWIVRHPYEEIQRQWKKKGIPPLLFLEDHCILVCSAFFRYQPLFDQYSCYRREFFDLAWTIRSRGGDVGMAINSVVVYQRLQPLTYIDLPYFLQRRQDYLCYSSQIYLNQKWQISYRYDRWHEKQRHESILDMKLDLDIIFSSNKDKDQDKDNGSNRFVKTVELLICFFVAVGANRFRFRSNDQHQDENQGEDQHQGEDEDELTGEWMSSFYPKISSIDWMSSSSRQRLQFRQELVQLNWEPSITPHMQDRFRRFLGTVPESEREQLPIEPKFLTNPFSGYCLFRLCCPHGETIKTISENPWQELLSQTKNFERCMSHSLKELPSLILQYPHPNQPNHSSIEAWVWVKTDLEIPDSILSMPSEGRSHDYDLIHSTLSSIAAHLHLTLLPSTDSIGTHLWQSCDLIRQEISSDGSTIETTAQLLHLSFRPQRLEQLQEILLWFDNPT